MKMFGRVRPIKFSPEVLPVEGMSVSVAADSTRCNRMWAFRVRVYSWKSRPFSEANLPICKGGGVAGAHNWQTGKSCLSFRGPN